MRMKPTTIRNLAAAALTVALLSGGPGASAQTISVSDAVLTEGNTGATNMTFNVTMSAPAAGVVRVRYLTGGGTAATTFSTSAQTGGGAVTIPTGAPATTVGAGDPYPSALAVSGLTGRVKSMTLTLVGLTHTFSDDLDILLVGPGGQTVMLMSDVGSSDNPAGDYTFSDLAVAQITDNALGPPGTYRPSNVLVETMAGPAPGGPYGNLLSVFNGTDPNGTWNLFIADDTVVDSGTLTSWKIDFVTATGDYAGQEGAVQFAISETSKTITIPIFGDATVEPSETFDVTLSDLEGAGVTIGDGAGVGTINDNDGPSRVFLSTAGNDASDCSLITTPCLTLAASLLKVTTDGEIIFLTGGEYDAVPISVTKGVKINAPTGVVAFIRQPITVNAPEGRVVLRGLTLKGTGTGNGVMVVAADAFYMENSTLDRWDNGLQVNTVAARIFVTGSVFRFNSDGIADDGSVAGTLIAVEQTRFEGNSNGINGFASTFSIRESTFFGNTNYGGGIGEGPSSYQGCEFSGNDIGVRGFGSIVRLDRNLIHGNTTGVQVNGTVETLGTNVIRGNTTNVIGALTMVAGG